jgi:hypothetical protein
MSIQTFAGPRDIDAFLRSIPKERIVSRECKHATYVTHRDELKDMLVVKEWVTLDDGSRYPTLKLYENFPRPYWVTKPHFRTHPDKIQFEDVDRLDMFKIPQCQLRRDICFRLGSGNPTNPIKQLARSPYVYGLDQGPEVFLKYSYMNKWPEAFQPNRIAVVDAETDVNGVIDNRKQLPILWSHVDDDEIILFANKQWMYDETNYVNEVIAEYKLVREEWVTNLRETMKEKKGKTKGQYPEWVDHILKIPVRVEVLDTHFDITKAMIDNLHKTQPDIVTGWNVFFDANVVDLSCTYAGHDTATITSDPRVPFEYQYQYLREGPRKKKMSSGREMDLEPQERWNVAMHSASWRFQDAMQTYWQLRKAKGKESGGYGLGAILDRQLKLGKITYPTEDSSIPGGTLHWHMEMQRKYKVRYGVYNIFDSLGVWVLDKKNNDLSSQISSLAGPTDYSNFNSQPKVNSNDMLFSVLKKRRKVICSTSDQMKTELDFKVLPKEGWIVTFPSYNVVDSGVFLFYDMPTIQSMINRYCADADVETTYPTAEIIQNLSKETTVAEPCRIDGVGSETQRKASINLTAGPVNSIEILQTVCNAPTMDEWLEAAKAEMKEEEMS